METTITLNTDICRICEDTNYLINLFDQNNFHLYNKLKEIENAQDIRDYEIYDNMFKYVCTSCENSIEGYYEFKTQCKNTRNKLVTALTCGIFAQQTPETLPDTVIIIDEGQEQEEKNIVNDVSDSSMEVIEYLEDSANYQQQSNYVVPDDSPGNAQEEEDLKIVSVYGQVDTDAESSSSKMVLCTICNKRVTARSFERHKNRHEQRKIFECTECFKTFLSKKNWIAHLKDHVSHQEYPCDKCDKSFSLLSHLKTHQLMHPEDRIYECTMCERSFSRLANLKGHMTRIHRIDISAIDYIQ
ncbi:hypothetical protein DMENIID0001_131330 [Sergentomyia squamirostris]